MEFKIEVAKPDWLKEAIRMQMQSLRLIANGAIPDVLVGRFIVAGCMRLLRCVYGSDLDAIAALRTKVLEDTAFWQKVDAMTPSEAKAFFTERSKEAQDVP